MPEIKHYAVTQTRLIRVRANSPADAAVIAQHAFRSHTTTDGVVNQVEIAGVWGNTTGRLEELDLHVKDQRS